MNTIQNFGGQNHIGLLRHVLMRSPGVTPPGVDLVAWGYSRQPDTEVAQREHQALVRLLRNAGCQVELCDPASNELLDAPFACDSALVTNAGTVLFRVGKPLRVGEAEVMAADMARIGVPILGRVQAPGSAEGGDLVWLDKDTLLAGHSYRTNAAGISQLSELLAPQGVQVLSVALPHWRGPDQLLHLRSLISLVRHDLAVVHSELLPVPVVEWLVENRFQLVEVPVEELVHHGANVLGLGGSRCIAVDGNPVTRRGLEQAGMQVFTYPVEELGNNMGGGPTCLVQELLRDPAA